jgi:hypothetical protein
MKHIKTYKIFESISNDDLTADLQYFFLELRDIGFHVDISVLPSGVRMITLEIDRDELYQWSEVEDAFERAKDYIEENTDLLLNSVYISYYSESDSKLLRSYAEENATVPKSSLDEEVDAMLQEFKGSSYMSNCIDYTRSFLKRKPGILIYELSFYFDVKKSH